MSPSDQVLFKHILDEIYYVETQVPGRTEATFLADDTAKRAITRSLEIIGEAVKNLSPALTLAHPEIEWRRMAGMRDKLIHGYFSVNYRLVWDVAVRLLPELKIQIEALLSEK